MKDNKKQQMIHNLGELCKQYVNVILTEYSTFMPPYKIEWLKSIDNFSPFIHIEETGTISSFVSQNQIYFPESADKITKLMRFVPGYGLRRQKAQSQEDMFNPKNDFSAYIKHVFLDGVDSKKFYEENLLHETMHLCGCDGGLALREGITELKTRELALKYNLTTTSCGYPKEVEIVRKMQSFLGEDFVSALAFAPNKVYFNKLLLQRGGEQLLSYWGQIESVMEQEFQDKYYSKSFPGLFGPIKKTRAYKQIDYTQVNNLVEECGNYITSLTENEQEQFFEQHKHYERTHYEMQLENGTIVVKDFFEENQGEFQPDVLEENVGFNENFEQSVKAANLNQAPENELSKI